MAFFSLRSTARDSGSAPAANPADLEVARLRARNRLVGAAVLVLAAGVALPLLFDRTPRALAPDVRVELADRPGVPAWTQAGASAVLSGAGVDLARSDRPAVALDESVAQGATAAASAVPPAPASAPGRPASAQSFIKNPPLAPVATAQTAIKTEASQARVSAPTVDAQRAASLLNGQPGTPTAASRPAASAQASASHPVSAAVAAAPSSSATAGARLVVQVGAFADAARVSQVRAKLEHAGLKTYAQAVDTKDGRRVRVRLGPYASRAEADKVAARVKKLGLPGVILTL